MKKWILLALISTPLWSSTTVLVSYFDSFGSALFNNSERIAHGLLKEMKIEYPSVELKLCKLNTIYDKSYGQLENCITELEDNPVMVLSMGESTCGLKVETMARNWDYNPWGADNAGTIRRGARILTEGAEVIGMRYPLPQMYCSLSANQREKINISNDAGSFVCNNTAYQMANYYPEIQYGFIHVPTNNCNDLEKLNSESIKILKQMIKSGVEILNNEAETNQLPHRDNELRLPTKKDEIRILKSYFRNKNKCLEEYFNRSKAHNQRGFFSGIMN